MTSSRKELIAEVTAGGHNFWDAHDQGRLAYLDGTPFKDNPHRLPTPGYYHINMTDWERGWKRQASAAAPHVVIVNPQGRPYTGLQLGVSGRSDRLRGVSP